MKARVAIYVGLGLVLLAFFDPRTFSDEDYSQGDDGGVILGLEVVVGWILTLGILAVVVVATESVVRRRARTREHKARQQGR